MILKILFLIFLILINTENEIYGRNMGNTEIEPMLSTIDQLQEELNNNPLDPTTFSRPDLCAVTHIQWNAEIDFTKHIIKGYVDLDYEKKNQSIGQLILDTSNLTILHIVDREQKITLKYELSQHLELYGSKLAITLSDKTIKSTVRITYETSSEANGIQWLKPEQTSGKLRPYLFSQCEATYCRSLIPLQDTPSVKSTYSATIRAPKDLVVLMSAIRVGNGTLSGDGLTKEYKFAQTIPIPSYLIAIVVGDLVSKPIGPRSHVWTEKELIEKSAYEFADTEKMITTAESIVGPYVWGVYDLLVLPPSFPYGGMENPCLTFVTPTLLAGDRSLAYVVAHEIAHSWTGNLVTNKNFDHLWLNEGMTTFLENKIVGRLSGGESLRQFLAIEGFAGLKREIHEMGLNNSLTKLVVDLRGVDTDDAVTSVPYEKGHTFLFYLEQLLGGPKVFEPFLKAYVEKFKYKSIDSNDFKSFLNSYFKSETNKLKEIDWEAWLYSPGMPPITPNYDNTLGKVSTALAKRWINANDSDLSQFNKNDIKDMAVSQIKEFFNQLLEIEPSLSKIKVEVLTKTYDLKNNHNSNIRAIWLRLGLKAHWMGCVDDAVEFVKSQGRLAFEIPIFKALYDWEETRQLSISTYKSISDQLMGITSKAIEKVLNIK